MSAPARTLAVYADTRGRGTCRGCGAAITWAEVVASGKRMPFTGDPVPLRTENERANLSDICAGPETPLGFTGGRVIEHLPFEDNHWAACPQRQRFAAKGRR